MNTEIAKRVCVIRVEDGIENVFHVVESGLTDAERIEISERRKSPEVRRKFIARLAALRANPEPEDLWLERTFI